MKYESNTPMFSKDIARKLFFVHMGRTYVRTDVRTRVMLYAPPHYKWWGHKKKKQLTGHFQSFCIYFFFSSPDPKSEKNPVNQLIKKFWPYYVVKCFEH